MAKYRLPPLARHGGYTARPQPPGYQRYAPPPQDDTVRDVLTGAGAYKLRTAYDLLRRKKIAGAVATLGVSAWKHRARAKKLYDWVKSAQEKRRARTAQHRQWEQVHTPPNRRLNFGHVEAPKIKDKRSGGRRPRTDQWDLARP